MTKRERMIEQWGLYYDALIEARDSSDETRDMIAAMLVEMSIGGDLEVISEQMNVIKQHIDILNSLMHVWDGFYRIQLES